MNAQDLCLALVNADTADSVISLLSDAGYWNDEAAWRDLGDNENNFSIAGAQQSDPIAALVEKLVNSVDSRLVNECFASKIEPESKNAPQSVREAVAQFIEHSDPKKAANGRLENWTASERREQAKLITVAATGPKANPCISISDEGEGQTPDKVPLTFMSIAKSNKLRIPFVQGKFNMGGTGALRFCGGANRLQLVVTRRNPALAESDADMDWSFTIVRRMQPTGGERSSVYRYLAPLKSPSSDKGQVLRFKADSLPLRPQANNAYALPQKHGALVKLYDYRFKGKSHILLTDGLLRQVDARLPNPALPFMMHECREYAGAPSSYSNPATGLLVRLTDDKGDNLDVGFPKYDIMAVDGQTFRISIFGFKESKAATYLNKSEGVLFTVNGQSHGTLSSRFFTRNKVNLDYVADSLLVCLDCSEVGSAALEEMFMNTRESLAESDFRFAVESHLEDFLKKHPSLREFNNRRREEKIKKKLEENDSLTDTLRDVLASSPSLAALFLSGEKIKSAFNTQQVGPSSNFVGKLYPTYFRFRNRGQGEELNRTAEMGRSLRIAFETDVEDNYFGRPKDAGSYKAEYLLEDAWVEFENHSLHLVKGHASLTVDLPEGVSSGPALRLRMTVSDDHFVDPFLNHATIQLIPFKEKVGVKPSPPKPPVDDKGEGQTGPSGIALPNAVWVEKAEWEKYDFTEKSAMSAMRASTEEKPVFDFYINRDNVHLSSELKGSKGGEELLAEQYNIGMLLLGMSVIHKMGASANGDDVADMIRELGDAASLVLLPMIRHLGNLDTVAKPKLKDAA